MNEYNGLDRRKIGRYVLDYFGTGNYERGTNFFEFHKMGGGGFCEWLRRYDPLNKDSAPWI
jgi:hypothetical protein